MLGPTVHAPPDDGLTRVDTPCFRRVVRRGRHRSVEREAATAAIAEQTLGVRGDPGNRLARASLATVQLREAIATRNYQIERADSALRRPPKAALIAIDFVRSRDPGVRVRRAAKDLVTIRGEATRSSGLSVAIDGEIFTIRLETGDRPGAILDRLELRFRGRYSIEIMDESGHGVTARIDAPILLPAT